MEAPDKIYIRPQTNPNMLGGLWSGKQTKETTVPYIRKDALLKWLESVASLNLFAIEGVANDYQHGKNDAYQHVIDKLQSL